MVDTNGKIVFKGHPASRKNLEEDFDKLLKGETLEGINAESNDEDEETEASMNVDLETAIDEMDKNELLYQRFIRSTLWERKTEERAPERMSTAKLL
ncbi:MAG: hypothetical protein ACK56F_09095, partial [bacterium]